MRFVGRRSNGSVLRPLVAAPPANRFSYVVTPIRNLAITILALAVLVTTARAQFIVTTTADCTGCGSLRDAINAANAAGTTNGAPNATTSTITFASGGIGLSLLPIPQDGR